VLHHKFFQFKRYLEVTFFFRLLQRTTFLFSWVDGSITTINWRGSGKGGIDDATVICKIEL